MSVMVFAINAMSKSEKEFSVPVFTEIAFNKIVLPVAERCGADMVCRFGIGIEIEYSDLSKLENELQNVIDQLPRTLEVEECIEPRISNMISRIRKIFEINQRILLYIG